jgi:hypothetical protein
VLWQRKDLFSSLDGPRGYEPPALTLQLLWHHLQHIAATNHGCSTGRSSSHPKSVAMLLLMLCQFHT